MAEAMGTSLLQFRSLLKANTYWAQANATKNSLNCLQRVLVPGQKKKKPKKRLEIQDCEFTFNHFNSRFWETISFPNCLRTEMLWPHSLTSMEFHSSRCAELAVEIAF